MRAKSLIEKAQELIDKGRVRPINGKSFIIYIVAGLSGRQYTVAIYTHDGFKYVRCDCEASRHDLVCYHVVAAMALFQEENSNATQ